MSSVSKALRRDPRWATMIALRDRAGRRQRAIHAEFGSFRPELVELDRELTLALTTLRVMDVDSARESSDSLRRQLEDIRVEIRSLIQKAQQ